MLRWIAVFLAAWPLQLAESWWAARIFTTPALTVALGLLMAFSVRPAAVPGLLLCTAVGQHIALGGDVALHVLATGTPIALLAPLRSAVASQALLLHGACAAFLALATPNLALLLARLSGAELAIAGTDVWSVAAAAALAPVLARLMALLPPWRGLMEKSR